MLGYFHHHFHASPVMVPMTSVVSSAASKKKHKTVDNIGRGWMLLRLSCMTYVLLACAAPVQSFQQQRTMQRAYNNRVTRLQVIHKHKPDLTSYSGVALTLDKVFTRDVLKPRKPSTLQQLVCCNSPMLMVWFC